MVAIKNNLLIGPMLFQPILKNVNIGGLNYFIWKTIPCLNHVMGAYFALMGCPYITSVELVDVSDMLYVGGSLYILAH